MHGHVFLMYVLNKIVRFNRKKWSCECDEGIKNVAVWYQGFRRLKSRLWLLKSA